MKLFPSLARLVLGVAVLGGSASAADVYVVHGINGTDLGLPESLEVDIEVNGAPTLDAVPFKGVAGALPLDPGVYEIGIRLDDGMMGSATGTLVLQTSVTIAFAETAVIVAHLDANGTITASKFTVDTGELAPGETRFTVAHAAAAPTVNVKAFRARVRLLSNGDQSFPFVGLEGDYDFRIQLAFQPAPSIKLDDVPLSGNVVLVAAGTLAKDTFTVIPVAID